MAEMISDIIRIEFNRSTDARGAGFKLSEIAGFTQNEIYVSESIKNVIRGMHFQPYPYEQRKAVFVIKGEITGVVLDLRHESESFRAIEEIRLNDKAEYGILIPAGCAWGFRADGTNNIILYSIEGLYNRDYDWGIRYDSIGYDWRISNPIISERDSHLPDMDSVIRRLQGA